MKRFTETAKWTDPWFRRLAPRLKCLWLYLVDQCDAAGVLDPDWEAISFQIGESVCPDDLSAFDGRVEVLANGKLHLLKFVAFQYGELSPSCAPHRRVLATLAAHGLKSIGDKNIGVCAGENNTNHKSIGMEGYRKGMDTLEEEDRTGQDKEEDKEELAREPLSWSKEAGWTGVGGVRALLEQTYPGRNLDMELMASDRWLRANGPKKNYLSFLRNWLKRSQPSGPGADREEGDGIRPEKNERGGGSFTIVRGEPEGWLEAFRAEFGDVPGVEWATLPDAVQRDVRAALAKKERGAA